MEKGEIELALMIGDTKSRGQGYGKEALELIENFIKENKYEKIIVKIHH